MIAQGTQIDIFFTHLRKIKFIILFSRPIGLMDMVSGPFHLEIAEIGLKNLEGPLVLQEKFAYEKYRVPHGLYLGTEI